MEAGVPGRQRKIKEPIAWDYCVFTLIYYQVKFYWCNSTWILTVAFLLLCMEEEERSMLLVFIFKGYFYTLWFSKRPNRRFCFSCVLHPVITRGTRGGLGACSVEVGAWEEQWDASAAEGPGGTDSQSAVSMAVLWKQVLLLTAAQGGISMLHTALVPRKQQTHKQNPTKPVDASLEHGFSFRLHTLPAALGEEWTRKHKSAKIRACYTQLVPPTSIWAPQNSSGGSYKFDQL